MPEPHTPPDLNPTPLAAPLDTFLREVVVTLHAAVDQGIRTANDAPAAADKAIADCKDILDVIMAGNVKDWLDQLRT